MVHMSLLDELRDRHRDRTQDGTQGGQRQDTRQCVCCVVCACIMLFSVLFHAAYVTVVGKEQPQNLIPKWVSSKSGVFTRQVQLRGLNCLNTTRRHVLIARYSQTIKPPPICGFSTRQSVHRNFSFVAGTVAVHSVTDMLLIKMHINLVCSSACLPGYRKKLPDDNPQQHTSRQQMWKKKNKFKNYNAPTRSHPCGVTVGQCLMPRG